MEENMGDLIKQILEIIKRKKILAIGNISWDKTSQVNDVVEPDHKYRVPGDTKECGGGPASTAAYLIAKWGMDTTFVGAIGDDEYGRKLKAELEAVGINTSYMEIDSEYKTTYSDVFLDSEGHRLIFTHRGEPTIEKPGLGVKNMPSIKNVDGIIIDAQELEASKRAINENPNAIKMLDAGRLKPATRELGKMVNFLVCSKDFAESLVCEDLNLKKGTFKININEPSTLVQAFESLEKEFDKQKIAITLGENGCIYKDKESNELRLIPTIKQKAVDTTGAGDLFHGALIFFLVLGFDFDMAIKLANVAAALSVTKVGTRNSVFPLETVLRETMKANLPIIVKVKDKVKTIC